MIIRIEEAPNIKNIKIDINFDDDNNTVNISSTGVTSTDPITNNAQVVQDVPNDQKSEDVLLDIDETYSEEPEEIIQKPEVPDPDRTVKVSDDMVNAEF